MSHILAVLSEDDEIIRSMVGENATDLNSPAWAGISSSILPSRSQSFTVWSCEAESIMSPLCEKFTQHTASVWPPSVLTSSPVLKSQSLMVLSCDPVTMVRLSREISIPFTSSRWPSAFAPSLYAGIALMSLPSLSKTSTAPPKSEVMIYRPSKEYRALVAPHQPSAVQLSLVRLPHSLTTFPVSTSQIRIL